jgi:conjugal transfer mating pair stabilization protein TraN
VRSGPMIAVLLLVLRVIAHAQNPHDEGIQAGRNAQGVISGFINQSSATAVLPPGYYTTSPPQTALYGAPNLAGFTAAQIAYCNSAAASNDLTCQAIRTALTSAATPRPPVLASDPAVVAANAVTGNPAGQGVALSGSYSACTTQTNQISPALYDLQSCNNYYLRSIDNTCQKTLTVDVTQQCPPDAIAGPTRTIDGSGAAVWLCQVQTTQDVYTCPGGWNGPALLPIPPSFNLDMGCSDPVSGQVMGATLTTVTAIVDAPVTAVATDIWDNQCAGYEARVPPGALPPDGVDAATAAGTIGSVSSIDKCYRTASRCSDPDTGPRIINDHPVTRACWQWSNTFDCVTADARSDCSQPRFGQCTALGSATCVEWDTITQPPFCSQARQDFRCRIADPVTQRVENCGTQTFCMGGTCWDASHPPDPDFARSVAYLEAGREAGKYLDASQLQVFKGFHNTCTKKLFGLVNCCNRGGTNALAMFTDLSLAINAASRVGKAAFSSYTYDALFASDAPNVVIAGFEGLFGTGFDSGLAGILAGDLSVADFVMSLMPSYWTLAMLAIQYSGILSCPDQDKVTAMKRDARLCVAFGDYCSRCITVFGRCVACLERTQSFCCFNSHLARIINEQGRGQIGKGWGSNTAQNPDCSGFTVAQLQMLDFARLDLSEFYAEISPTLPSAATYVGNANSKISGCYFGNGKC